MPLVWKDRIKVASSTTGTGTLTLGVAASGYQTFASGDNGKMYAYVIEDGTAWETGYGVYTHSGTTFARTTRTDSSTGSAISCTGAEFLFVDLVAAAAALDFLPIDSANPISVTGATTATLGKLHIVTGTSADYTITLPAGPSSATPSNCLGFIFAEALTKIVTLDGNGSETINTALTRKQRNGETTYLRWDGAEWVKVAGVSIPMTATMARVTDQSFGASTFTQILLTAQTDGLPQMWDAGNNRGVIVRPGRYNAFFSAYISGLSVGGYLAVGVNGIVTSGAVVSQFNAQSGALQGVAQLEKGARSLVAGDWIAGSAYGDNSPVCAASVVPATLSIVEVITW